MAWFSPASDQISLLHGTGSPFVIYKMFPIHRETENLFFNKVSFGGGRGVDNTFTKFVIEYVKNIE